MKYVMNKRVTHNGKDYPKGSEIEKGAEGFEVMHQAGHVDEVGGDKKAEAKSEQAEQGKEPVQSEKPAAKPKK